MTLAQMLARAQERLTALLAERTRHTESLNAMRAAVDSGDDSVTIEAINAVIATRDTTDAAIDVARADVDNVEAEIARDAVVAELATRIVRGAPRPAYDEVARVSGQARTYSTQSDPHGAMFLRDVAAAALGAFDSRDRIETHMREERIERGNMLERVGTTSGAFAGLVVPQYLTDLVAPAAAVARPFAQICSVHPLPATGNTVNISRITTATSAAAQSAENADLSQTDIDDTLLTETMFTVGGSARMSRQAIDRGIGTEDVTLDDLVRRYHSALDAKLINDGTTGIAALAQSNAYTDANPTAAELWPKVVGAQAALEAVMLDRGIGDVYAVMHSRRWAWLNSQVGSTWPFVSSPGIPVQAGGVTTGAGYGEGVRGILPNGIRVIVDNNIGTTLGAGTEDEIYLVNASELHLWEDASAPLLIRAEQPYAASLGVLLVVYGYAAYCFRRYTNGHQKIAGTGLIAPTF